MAFYREYDLPGLSDPLCRCPAARARYLDNALSAMAFLKTHPEVDDFEIDGTATLSLQYLIPEDSPAERKVRADEIAATLGAATEWRNGYYMARLSTLEIPAKIYFYPPILLADFDSDGAAEAA